MFQRRPFRNAPRSRSLALGGVVAALAVVGGGTAAVVSSPAQVDAGDILLAQNATDQAAAQEMPLGEPVNVDLEPVVAEAAGGTIPAGTTVKITGLPDGLTQDGWVISGTPTRAGDYDVLVTVSNSGVSKSQRVAITVTDEGTGATTETTEQAETAESPETTESTEAPETGESGESPEVTEPTLSARAGDPARSGDEGAATATQGTTQAGDDAGTGGTDGAGDGLESDDDEVGTSPDLCAALGDGQLDAASLAQLVPAVVGDEDSASTGLVLTLFNAVVSLLPSVLGEDGSLGDLGSAGTMLCTLAPSLLGSQGEAPTAVDGTTATTGDGATATTGHGATATTATGAAGLPIDPSALAGLLTTATGSLGE
ncbi:hypothetical protein NCCP2495_27510 [Dietzia sp. NCCP-2495]|uniref:hypothetical protein n=1 Tax=Dietzia sp. NCCP-2495 TaxID=2934675 RepID=UPI00222E9AE6|nr:hypothetical protein [Dietzia sp. NCCP-2495]GLB64871.1 hypothetical protein NCCP2495_27510 [Dietzia sp. NCCP-2495]